MMMVIVMKKKHFCYLIVDHGDGIDVRHRNYDHLCHQNNHHHHITM